MRNLRGLVRVLLEDARQDLRFAVRSLRREPGVAAGMRLMGVTLRDGRLFGDADGRGAPLVVLVNETMARSLWPGERAVGKCIRVGFDPAAAEPSPLAPATLPCRQIIGVVRDSRVRSIRPTDNESRLMQYYVPFGQQPAPFVAGGSQINGLLVGTLDDPSRMIASVQRFLQATATMPLYARVSPYEDLLDPQIRPWRLGASLFSALGGLALAIAALGLFAVVSYLVTQRLREIGIRLALGGTSGSIARLVVGGATRLVALGAVLGAIAAFALAPLMQSMLFETSAYDVGVIGVVAAVLAMVAIAASSTPAWRASRVSPSRTLQAE